MIRTGLRYLAPNDLYRTEKPYSADFDVDEEAGAKKGNLITVTRDVNITPITNRGDFDININGFCILKAETSLTAEDALEKPDEVEPIYQAELEALLHARFPGYKRFESLDFVVSSSIKLLLRSFE